jgi:hypothetical protein
MQTGIWCANAAPSRIEPQACAGRKRRRGPKGKWLVGYIRHPSGTQSIDRNNRPIVSDEDHSSATFGSRPGVGTFSARITAVNTTK